MADLDWGKVKALGSRVVVRPMRVGIEHKGSIVLIDGHPDRAGDPPTMLSAAMKIATSAHAGQVDKAGQPYIDHPVRIASMVDGTDAKVVALLHDVVEDSTVTLADLGEVFPPRIVAAVDSVTRRSGETYFEFISRAAADPLGKVVKRADVEDHLGPGHERAIPATLIKRYRKALTLLRPANQTHP